jgi:hypothetical protein
LRPIDGSADPFTGTFPCGRQPTIVENKEFLFPSNMTCDNCMLQWEWDTNNGAIYQCADISIIDNESKEN